MPRGPRLDCPGTLHHVRARGIERRPIFEDDCDREDFLGRLASLVEVKALRVFAWALMPNHVHLLVQTGSQALHRSMRALLGGYATSFNRRHGRAGHLFQNRYKSTLCEDEEYFLKLLQYIHLNPVSSIVLNVDALAHYAWTGHSALLGFHPRRWQETTAVLARFGDDLALAQVLYEQHVHQGIDADTEDLHGGGLIRGRDGIRYVPELRRGRERFTSHERILGRPEFVERTIAETQETPPTQITLDELIERVCSNVGVSASALAGSGRPRRVSDARRGIAYFWTLHLGRSGRELAARLGVCPSAVYQSARNGRAERQRWNEILRSIAGRFPKLHNLRNVPKFKFRFDT